MIRILFLIFLNIVVSCASDQGANLTSSGKKRPSSLVAMNSLKNNQLVPQFVDLKKARKHALTYRGGDSVTTLEKRIAALRVAKSNFSEVQAATLKLANLELEKSLNRSMSERAKIEVGLSALQNRKFGMAMILFDELHRSKNKTIRAASWTATGVLALQDQRHPEAVRAWEEALKSSSSFAPAILNLAFMNLRFGRFKEAQSRLQQAGPSWLKDAGLMILARVKGQKNLADNLCEKLLSIKPNHKMILFNCGVHQWVSHKDKDESKSLIRKALKEKGGESNWNVRGRQFLSRIR
ncbi:MAG: hypothetical protein AB8C84_03205 [Oligoflexales bacterium]